MIKVGNLELETFETPGHCDGHLSFLMRGGDRTYLLGADLVFWGGKVVWQNIHDCRIDAYADSMFKMEKVEFDALVPGHLQISLTGGKVHLDAACAAFRQLGCPAEFALTGSVRAGGGPRALVESFPAALQTTPTVAWLEMFQVGVLGRRYRRSRWKSRKSASCRLCQKASLSRFACLLARESTRPAGRLSSQSAAQASQLQDLYRIPSYLRFFRRPAMCKQHGKQP